MSNTQTRKDPATWRILMAAIFDFITAFFAIGFGVASIFGGITDNGFNLTGFPAFLSFVLIVAYFMLFNRFFNGTIWKHILHAQR